MSLAELQNNIIQQPRRYRVDSVTTSRIDRISGIYPETGIEKTPEERDFVLRKIKNNPIYKKLPRKSRMAVKKYVCRKVLWWKDQTVYIRQAIAVGQLHEKRNFHEHLK